MKHSDVIPLFYHIYEVISGLYHDFDFILIYDKIVYRKSEGERDSPDPAKLVSYKNSRPVSLKSGRLFLMFPMSFNVEQYCYQHGHECKHVSPCYHNHHPFRRLGSSESASPGYPVNRVYSII